MHIQDFGKFSSLVIFKLSSCDSSPSLITGGGGSSKVDKISSTHPNPILSVAMSFISQREDMRKNSF
jgi:hypothetical protein